MIALVSWFGYSFWQLRDIWADVYVLHNRERPESERISAALRLSRDARVNDAQLMEMGLERDLPPLARYLLAEAVSTEAVARDPRGFALTVARVPTGPSGCVCFCRAGWPMGRHEAMQSPLRHSTNWRGTPTR